MMFNNNKSEPFSRSSRFSRAQRVRRNRRQTFVNSHALMS